jgi:hypothetical protein
LEDILLGLSSMFKILIIRSIMESNTNQECENFEANAGPYGEYHFMGIVDAINFSKGIHDRYMNTS